MKPTEKHLDELLLAIQKVMNGDSSPSCKIVNNHAYRNKLSQKNISPLKAKVYDEEERSWFRQGLPLEGYRSQMRNKKVMDWMFPRADSRQNMTAAMERKSIEAYLPRQVLVHRDKDTR